MLRSAYDPAVAATLERHGELGRDLATAGPVAVTETWRALGLRPPRGAVGQRVAAVAGVSGLPIAGAAVVRRPSVVLAALHADAVRSAARDIRKKKIEYISDRPSARIGQIEDASQSAEYRDVLQQEADLTAGHGILRSTGLIACPRPPRRTRRAVAAIEQAAIQASCETRRLRAAGPGVLRRGASALPSGLGQPLPTRRDRTLFRQWIRLAPQ